jgi:hypothetical protein
MSRPVRNPGITHQAALVRHPGLIRHPGEGRDLGTVAEISCPEIPAFTGMTEVAQ